MLHMITVFTLTHITSRKREGHTRQNCGAALYPWRPAVQKTIFIIIRGSFPDTNARYEWYSRDYAFGGPYIYFSPNFPTAACDWDTQLTFRILLKCMA